MPTHAKHSKKSARHSRTVHHRASARATRRAKKASVQEKPLTGVVVIEETFTEEPFQFVEAVDVATEPEEF